MGWKHRPVRWWKDGQAERDAYDTRMEQANREQPWWTTAMEDEIEVRFEMPVRFWYYGVIDVV